MNKQETRREQALAVRRAAAELAASRPHPEHVANGDEQKFRTVEGGKPSGLMSFTKGLPHDKKTGLVSEPDHFQQFIRAINSGDVRDFRDTPLGMEKNCTHGDHAPQEQKLRAWESQSAGLSFELEGPDSQAVTMPPAPRLGGKELAAEIGEVYLQALLRDEPLSHFAPASKVSPKAARADGLVSRLNDLDWFKGSGLDGDRLSVVGWEGRRRGYRTLANTFRGITPGDDVGPYLSQFLLAGSASRDGKYAPKDGRVSYGSITIDQRGLAATPGEDYLQVWGDWLDVQNAADTTKRETYQPSPRFITTGRDLATYVHLDALYEAYLNACLLLLANGVPLDPGIPFQDRDYRDHQQGFAHFGGPHILSLVTEVATRALKAVRFQKFNVHRRLRPEALAARMDKRDVLEGMGGCPPELGQLFGDLELSGILSEVAKQNAKIKGNGKSVYLLPMAFSEGSPMHPTYGAGHATVAGACVTILKAFFDAHHPLDITGKGSGKAFVPTATGTSLSEVAVKQDDGKGGVRDGVLTVEGELNKLASNISIGRNWAGVHYFSDYIESLRMGERIAIGILEEQRLTYGENFTMTVPLFDGGSVSI